MSNKDSLGDRIKAYEQVFSRTLVPRSCVMVRCDGRAFHTYTRGCEKPFDIGIICAMQEAARSTMMEMQGCKVCYIQSDEVSFLLSDFDGLETQGWFGYNHSKIVSVSASIMTAHFNKYIRSYSNISKIATFDSRAFTIPKEEAANALLWRAKDWHRNSIQMYARAFFSHSELKNKKIADIHEMLHSIGKNWAADLSETEKNGTMFVLREGMIHELHPEPNYKDIATLINPLIGLPIPQNIN